MSDIIINDPNNIIVNDGGSGGGSNILDVTWNVEAVYGPVATYGDGNKIHGLVGIRSELDGITVGEILDHIDNGGLVRYHLNETAPEGYGLWITDAFQFPSDFVVCDGRYILDIPNAFLGIISVDGVFIQPYLNVVAMLTGADGPVALVGDESIFQFPIDINLFVKGVSSGSLKKSQDDVGSPFISQPLGDNGFLLRTIEYNQDNDSFSNKQYSILKNGDFPIIEEIPIGEQQIGSADVDLSLGLGEFIERFVSEYFDPESPRDGYSLISLNGSENESLTNILNNLDNTILLSLNKRRISVWKYEGEDNDDQWITLSPISDSCYTTHESDFHFDCSYHCFSFLPGSGVDISIHITFTASQNRGQGYSVSPVNAAIGGFAFRAPE